MPVPPGSERCKLSLSGPVELTLFGGTFWGDCFETDKAVINEVMVRSNACSLLNGPS